MKILLSCLLVCTFSYSGFAQRIKVGVMAPEGTSWANSMKKLAKEVEKETAGEVKFKVYYGGVAGDESDVLRKIRVGQLQGGFFTGKTLGEISKDIRAIELPFNFFSNRAKAFEVLESLKDKFAQSLASEHFKSLGFFEIGQVYLVSTKKVTSLEELKGVKIWSWEGDEIVKTMMDSLNLVSIPLALPDVLASLSTGVIEAAYAPPLGIMALQWHTKIKYLVDYPVAYSIGSMLIDNKTWDKISKKNQEIIEKIAQKYTAEINTSTVKENAQALEALKASGVEFLSFSKDDYAKSSAVRSQVVKKLEDKVISKKSIEWVSQKLK